MAHSALVLIKISANLISALKLVLFMLLCVCVSGTSLVPKSNRSKVHMHIWRSTLQIPISLVSYYGS